MKWLFLFVIMLLISPTLISAEIIPVDEKYESKCEAGIGWIFCKAGEIWENWFKDRVIEISYTDPNEEVFVKPEISYLDLYPEKYQKIETEHVTFELPIEAEHYWLDEKGDADLYEVILHNVSVDGKDYMLRLTWTAPRNQDDTIKIDYNFKDGKLYEENIIPYSATENPKTEFNNFKVEMVEEVAVEKTQTINQTCLKETNIKLQDTTKSVSLDTKKEVEKCEVIEVKPIYEFKTYEPIVTTIKGDFKAIDDIVVSSCGTLSSGNTRYYLTGNLTGTGSNCLTINANGIILDGNGYSLRRTGSSTGSGVLATSRNNLTIKNLTVIGYYHGLGFTNVDRSLITDINIINTSGGSALICSHTGTNGCDNNIVNNFKVTNSSFQIVFYANNNTFQNINLIVNRDVGDAFYLLLNHRNTTITNLTLNGTYLAIDAGNYTYINNLISYNGIRDVLEIREGAQFIYGNNLTFLNTKSSGTFAPITITGLKNSYFKDVYINKSESYGLNLYTPFDYNVTNVTFENIKIENTKNESIYIISSSSSQTKELTLINATYTNEKVVKTSGVKAELNRGWIASVKVNDTTGFNLSSIPTYGLSSKLNNTEKIPDYSFEDEAQWNKGGDAIIEGGYFYVYDLDSGGEAPHTGGTLTTATPLNPQAGNKYTIKLVDVDTSSGGVSLNVSMCGNSYGFAQGFYGSDERTITCTNSNQLNISVPADTIGSGGFYYTGITDYISIKKWEEITEDTEYTDSNGNARLKLIQYTNLNGVTTYQTSNHTIYAVNLTYNSSQNMSTNRNVIFTLPHDTTAPTIEFVAQTSTEGITTNTYLFANVSATDTFPGLKNITIYLYNLTSLVSSQTSTTSPFFYNFTGLTPTNYTINATAYDSVNNINQTASKNYQVIDIINPIINRVYPTAINYSINVTTFNFLSSDANLQSCWYNLGFGNISSTCNSPITSITSQEGLNTWIAYANDTSGNIGTNSVTFYVETLENITFCRTLSTPLNYQVRNNLATTGTCLVVGTNNVNINGNGFIIDGDDIGSSDYGIYASSRTNTTITNFSAIKDFYYGIYLLNSINGIVTNVNISSNLNAGLIFAGASGRNNTINNNTFDSNLYGIFLSSSSNNNLNNNIISSLDFGLYLSSSNNNTFTNINSNSPSAGTYLLYSNNNYFKDSIFSGSLFDVHILGSGGSYCSGTMYDTCDMIYDETACNEQPSCNWDSFSSFCDMNYYLYPLPCSNFQSQTTCEGEQQGWYCYWFVGPSIPAKNNTFLNVSYSLNKENIGVNGELIRQWYYSALVKDVYENRIHNATVEIKNKTNDFVTSMNTSYSGNTPTTILIDYINNAGTRLFYSPYNNTAYSNIPAGVYAPKSELWNLTLQQNNIQTFIFGLNVSVAKKQSSYGYYNNEIPVLINKSGYQYNYE